MKGIFQHEVKYYFKTRQEVTYLYSYFISIALLVPFAIRYENFESQELAPIALWVALASGISIGATSLFKRDSEQGRLEYYQLLPCSLEGIVCAKWLAFFLFVSLPLLAVLPVAGLLFNLNGESMLRYALGLGAGSMALSTLSTLVAALTAGLEKAGAILSLIMLPLSIPIMIFGAQYCRGAVLWQPNLGVMLGFAAFMLPIMCIAGAYSIRRSN